MSDLKITGVAGAQSQPLAKTSGKAAEGGFDQLLQDAIGKVNEVQSEAEKAIGQLASGGDIAQAVIAMEKADMTFQVMVEVRNKLLNAYEEIMRMQV